MNYRLVEAKHLSGNALHLRYDDGVEGDIDLSSELHGPIFEPLKDVDYFKRFTLDAQLHTLVWPNGADFAPEFLRRKLRVAA